MRTFSKNEAPAAHLASKPVAVRPEEPDILSDELQNRLIWAFLILGLAVRLVRFALRFPLWHDECYLAVNLLDRGYGELAQPLDCHQVCPVGFLWVQLALTRLLGFTEYSLRLFPFLCGLGSLFMFRYVAGRLIRGTALVLAVAIFAVAYPLVRYSVEAKPYCGDVFVALVLLSLAVTWWQHRDQTRWIWLTAAFTPLGMLLSYPAVFVFGGVSIAVGWVLWVDRPRRGWIGWGAMNAVGLAAFAAIFHLAMRNQGGTELGFMRDYWDHAFPPSITEPFALLWWLAKAHTGSMLSYPIGDANFGSTATFVCCVVGGVLFWRRRHWPTLILLSAPLVAAMVAAALHRYPYGCEVRFQLYAAPMLCVFTGLGLAAIIRLNPKDRRRQPVAALVLLGLISLIGFGSIGRDLVKPYKSLAALNARDFARWFWFNARHDGPVLCLETDLHQQFTPAESARIVSALYLCNQRIYSPRHHRGERLTADRTGADETLRCVEYRCATIPRDEEALQKWLSDMQSRYRLVATEQLPFFMYDRSGEKLLQLDYLEVYQFEPKQRPGENQVLEAQRSIDVRR